MTNNYSLNINNALDAMIPISRFNKGEANKIFDEVKKSGYKIVLEDNAPAGIIISPEWYQEMMEDQYLLALAQEREKYGSGKTYSEEEVMRELGITEQDLEDAEELEIE